MPQSLDKPAGICYNGNSKTEQEGRPGRRPCACGRRIAMRIQEQLIGRGLPAFPGREEAVRLGLLAGVGLERPALEALVDKLSPEELAALSKAWEQQAGRRYPLKTQLRYEEQSHPVQERDGAFLI